jgi:hypothetical protein
MQYANHYGYTDVDPYEVVRRVSDITLEIREMNAVRGPSVPLQFIPGGFSAHCVNQYDQKWLISTNESAPIIRIRFGKNGWKDKDGRRYKLSDKPVKFYDYNF